MRQLRHIPLVIVLGALAALCWVLITRASERARWLQIEGPAQFVLGSRAQIMIRLQPPLPAGLLCVDLHWKNARRESRGTLSVSRPQAIGASATEFRFDLPVPARPGLEYIYGVIYVTPTGRWSDRTRVCLTDPLPVSSTVDPAQAGKRRAITAQDQALGPPPRRQDSAAARRSLALLWPLAGILCWRVGRRLRSAHPDPTDPQAGRWAWLAFACVLAAAWEATAAEPVLGDLLRRFAMTHGWYDDRRRLQEVMTALVIAISVLLAALALRRDHAQPVSLVFTSADAYWGISAISFISLHDADAWLATPVFSIPVVQVVKLAAAFVAICGAAQAALSGRQSAPGIVRP